MVYCENGSTSYGTQAQSPLSSSFPSISIVGAAVHSCGAGRFQSCIQCDRVSDDRIEYTLLQCLFVDRLRSSTLASLHQCCRAGVG